MKKFNMMVILSALVLSFSAVAQEAVPMAATAPNTRITNPSSIIAEILGRGLVYMVGFDRVLTEDISVGVGFSTSATERNGVDTGNRAYMIPTYVNFYFNRTPGSLFLTGGADVIVNSGKVKSDDAATSGVSFPKDALMPTFGAGWEHRAEGGFLFRLTGYGIAGRQLKPWAGFTFGMGF